VNGSLGIGIGIGIAVGIDRLIRRVSMENAGDSDPDADSDAGDTGLHMNLRKMRLPWSAAVPNYTILRLGRAW
jgi:hypothetical protein